MLPPLALERARLDKKRFESRRRSRCANRKRPFPYLPIRLEQKLLLLPSFPNRGTDRVIREGRKEGRDNSADLMTVAFFSRFSHPLVQRGVGEGERRKFVDGDECE